MGAFDPRSAAASLHSLEPIAYLPMELSAVSLLILVVAVVVVLMMLMMNKNRNPSPPSANASSIRKKRKYTASEVASHNSTTDLWIIVDGKVYDVTEYVGEHPGGDAIAKNAGGDATEGMHGPQHPSRVFDMLVDYHIGDLQEDDDKTK